MPFVRIQLKSGRSPEQKAELAHEIIQLMDRLNFAQKEKIRVIYEDMAPEDFYSGEDLIVEE